MAVVDKNGYLTFADGRRFLLVTLDYETYFCTKTYTLKKMSTSDYVRDDRFKAHMVSVKIGRGKTQLIPHEQIKAYLTAQHLKWDEIALLAHNNLFDGLITSHHYGIVPAYYCCSLKMARALHSSEIGAGLDEVAQFYKRGNKMPDVLMQTNGIRDLPKDLFLKEAAYCVVDTDLCFDVFNDMLPLMPEDELDLIHLTINAFANPVLRVDTKLAMEVHQEELARRAELFKQYCGTEDFEAAKEMLGKNEVLADMLRALGIEPPLKYSLKQKKMIYAFAKGDEEFAALLDHEDDMVAGLVESRLAVKSTLNVTRSLRIYEAGRKRGWRLPVGYLYYGATTGRWSGTNKMNLQNLPRGGKLRRCVLSPSERESLNVLDSSQIEARTLAWIAGAEWKLQLFRDYDTVLGKTKKTGRSKGKLIPLAGDPIEFMLDFDEETEDLVRAGPDNYRVSYAKSFHVPVEEVTKDQRQIGKVQELALGYGGAVGAFKSMAKNYGVRLDDKEVQKIVSAWRRANPEVAHPQKGFWAQCNRVIEAMYSGKSGTFGRDGLLRYESKKNRDGTADGRIWLPNGMCLKYPSIGMELNQWGKPEYSYFTKRYGRKKIYGGLITENIVQALARIVVAEQILAIWRELKRRIGMTTHDEVVFVSPNTKARTDQIAGRRIFQRPPKWGPTLPVNGDGGWAREYSK